MLVTDLSVIKNIHHAWLALIVALLCMRLKFVVLTVRISKFATMLNDFFCFYFSQRSESSVLTACAVKPPEDILINNSHVTSVGDANLIQRRSGWYHSNQWPI